MDKVDSSPCTVPDLAELQRQYKDLDDRRNRLEEKVLELFTLFQVGRVLSVSMSLDELFGAAIGVLGESLNISEYALLLLDEKTRELVIRASHGMSNETVEEVRFPIGEGISGRAFLSGETIIVDDVSQEPAFLHCNGYKQGLGSFICVPLKLSNGRVVGVLNAHRPEKGSFTPFDEKLFTSVAEQIAIAIERTDLYEKTREMVLKDSLTGIHNRRYFFEHAEQVLEQCRRYRRALSVVMVDIDDFKCFNDTHGHMRGDDVLRKTASVLRQNLRKGDILARYGGEEFCILLPETGMEAAVEVAEKLRRAVCAVCDKMVGISDPCTVTMGVASYPEDGHDLVVLIEMADRLMYRGKIQGKNKVVHRNT